MALSTTSTTGIPASVSRLATEACDGASTDTQWRIITTSGAMVLMASAVDFQEGGQMLSRKRDEGMACAVSSALTTCVFPGNSKPGYCREKFTA